MSIDDIDRVIDFIAERDPVFPAQIKGAAPHELDRLERAMGQPLQPAHRRFLERMGRGSSWLRLNDGRFDIDSLIRYYDYYGGRNPEGHILMGRAEGESEYDFYLRPEDQDHVRVVSFALPYSPKRVNRIAGSLTQWIGDRALATFSQSRLEHERTVDDPEGAPVSRLAAFDDVMHGLGADPLWYSNDWMRTYELPDAVVDMYENPESRILLGTIKAANRDELNRVYAPVREFVRGH